MSLPKYKYNKTTITINEAMSKQDYEVTETYINPSDAGSTRNAIAALTNIAPIRVFGIENNGILEIIRSGLLLQDIIRYANNEFPLIDEIGILKPYNLDGKYFNDLDEQEKEIIMNHPVEFYHIKCDKEEDKEYITRSLYGSFL